MSLCVFIIFNCCSLKNYSKCLMLSKSFFSSQCHGVVSFMLLHSKIFLFSHQFKTFNLQSMPCSFIYCMYTFMVDSMSLLGTPNGKHLFHSCLL